MVGEEKILAQSCRKRKIMKRFSLYNVSSIFMKPVLYAPINTHTHIYILKYFFVLCSFITGLDVNNRNIFKYKCLGSA